MTQTILPDSPVPVVAPRGDIDLATSRDLGSQLGEIAGEPGVAAVLDLSQVTFMDSIGLAAVVHARSRLGADSRLALVVAPDSYAELVLEIAGMPRAFAIFADREAAIAHVRG